jgi:hypothetical protein
MNELAGATPTFVRAVRAIGRGDVEALQLLLDGAPELVHERGPAPALATLLHYSAFNGSEELAFTAPPTAPRVAHLLLERGAQPDSLAFEDPRGTPLCWSLSSWHAFSGGVQNELADAYLDGGAAIEGVLDDGAPLGHAVGFGYTPAVEHLVSRGDRARGLPAACALGEVERVLGWLRPDARFEAEALDFTRGEKAECGRFSWPPPQDPDPLALALVTAATHGRVHLVEALLEAGADPDRAVSFGQTALHFAAYCGHAEIVGLLLRGGARRDLREAQFDRTPAQWARETGEEPLAMRIENYA